MPLLPLALLVTSSSCQACRRGAPWGWQRAGWGLDSGPPTKLCLNTSPPARQNTHLETKVKRGWSPVWDLSLGIDSCVVFLCPPSPPPSFLSKCAFIRAEPTRPLPRPEALKGHLEFLKISVNPSPFFPLSQPLLLWLLTDSCLSSLLFSFSPLLGLPLHFGHTLLARRTIFSHPIPFLLVCVLRKSCLFPLPSK